MGGPATLFRTLRLLTITLLLSVPPLLSLSAQTLFEKLVLPGDLIEGHAKLEKECGNCHEPFSKASQRRLCLDCHKDVRIDIDNKSGMHGKRPDVGQVECKHCHTDHKGRKADIVALDRQTFNHTLTDFDLKGGHRKAQCAGCHAANTKFRAAPSTCIGCHKKDDAHKGRLGEKCADCHGEETWRKQKPFDHGKTRFPLEDKHKEVSCAACHVGERYKDIPRDCVGCHRIQDAHNGRYGEKCATCHAPTKWKSAKFDHDRKTKFPLKGEHGKVKCDACHTGELYGAKLATTCVSCHRDEDPHKGSLGLRCETCHAETGWRKKVAFDHDITRFPLIGLHARVPCEECHRTQTFKGASTLCHQCHNDTRHKARLGPTCSGCHNPNGWAIWRFDHERQTKFPLTGAHKGLDCHACHSKPATAKVTAPTTCIGCHADDDAHRGAFGRACETCHSTTSFRRNARP